MHRDMRHVTAVLCSAFLALLTQVVGAADVAAVRVESTRPAAAGILVAGALINTNRPYTFATVPPTLSGLHYVVHAHKSPADLTLNVAEGGVIYILLWEPTDLANLRLQRTLKHVAALPVGNIATEPFHAFSLQVAAGESLTIPAPDRWGAVVAARQIAGLGAVKRLLPPSPHGADAELHELTNQIARHRERSADLKAKLRRESLRPDALIHDDDRTPLSVILRRTLALAVYLQRMHPSLDLSSEVDAVRALRQADKPDLDAATQSTLFRQAREVRRRTVFRNPLLRGLDRIIFLKHDKQVRGYRHMIDQYLGFNARPGGGIFILANPFSDAPVVTDLLADRVVANGRLAGTAISGTGSFLSLELDYDAGRLLFAWTEAVHTIPADASYDEQYWPKETWQSLKSATHYHYRPDNAYHVFSTDVQSRAIRQLTDGRWNEFDPCFLPNGRIVFVSERAQGGIRCGSRPLVSTTLHGMMSDGSDIIALSRHDTNEWHPSVDHDGMIVYTRWDYVDRDSDIAHHLWRCLPDGRDPRSLHGNYPDVRESRPWMEMSIRAIPGSRRFVATATPHHGEAYGSLVVIDERVPDDRAMSQLQRLTPEYHLPEAEADPGVLHPTHRGRHSPRGEAFATAWPLDEDFYLCVFAYDQRNYGIYLLDSFGNNELLYADRAIPCLDPMPLRPRRRPPVIPVQTTQAKAEKRGSADTAAHLFIANVYDSEFPLPSGTRLTELRIVNVFPKSNAVLDQPRVGVASQSLARGVLGTVPIERDGSVYCELPADVGVYFQVLGQDGVALQTMRSITYAHAGEMLSCIGCHEPKHRAPVPRRGLTAMALQRPPSEIQREATGSYPLTFPRLVQPALDRHCVGCHVKSPKAPKLAGDRFGSYGWSEAALALHRHAWGMCGGNGSGLRRNGTSYSVPGKVGARASKLYPMLSQGHHGVVLPAADMRRITLWLDANSCFYGAYYDAVQQAKGAIVAPKSAYLSEWVR